MNNKEQNSIEYRVKNKVLINKLRFYADIIKNNNMYNKNELSEKLLMAAQVIEDGEIPVYPKYKIPLKKLNIQKTA